MAFENDAQLPPELSREDRYILHNYYRLLNRGEKLRHRWYLAKRRGDERVAKLYETWLGADGGTVETECQLLAGAAARLRREFPERVVITHCPKCEAITRTPRSRICPECGHQWAGEGNR